MLARWAVLCFVFEIFVGGLMRWLLLTGLKAETVTVVQFGRALG
jgi:hypothetical protein